MNLGWAYEQKAMYAKAVSEFEAASVQQPMSMGMSSPMDKPAMAGPMSREMSAGAARVTVTRANLVVLATASLGHALGVAGGRVRARPGAAPPLRERGPRRRAPPSLRPRF